MRRSSSIASSSAFALALIAALGVLYAVIARIAFGGFPYSGDEYSLVLQGDLFAHGVLHVAAPAHAEWFRIDHVVIDQWVRSKYPPGAPALLALGARQGLAWLVTPIEAVAGLVVVWRTIHRLLGAREALVGLVVIGVAPLYAFDAASFYAHTPTLLFLAVAFAAVAVWVDARRDRWLVLAGIAIGCAFLVRPVDALLFGLAMLVFRSPRAVIIPAVAALPLVVLNLAYQNAQFGSPFIDGYHAYEPTFRALYGAATAATPLSPRHLISPIQQWNHLDIFRQMITDWTVPGSVIVAVFGAFAIGRDHPRVAMRRFAVAVIAVFVIGLLPMISDPDDGPHPRYLTITLVPIAFLAAAGWSPTCDAITARFGARVRTLFVALGVLFALAALGSFLESRIPEVWAREGLYTAVAEQHLHRAVVIVRARYPSRFARNSPFDDDVIYLSAPVETPTGDIAAAFPDREIWLAREGEPWTLERVR